MAMTAANGTPGWPPPTRWISSAAAAIISATRALAIEAAVHGHGVALGDSVTASTLLARGLLVAPFSLSVPAVDDFYVVCRNEMRSAPIVQVFIDWLFAEKEQADSRADAPVAGRIGIRRKRPALQGDRRQDRLMRPGTRPAGVLFVGPAWKAGSVLNQFECY